MFQSLMQTKDTHRPVLRILSNQKPVRSIIKVGDTCITEPASKSVDYFIKPMLPSYIQVTTHVLNIIKEMKNKETSILSTVDMESLCTNIDNGEGLEALSHYLEIRFETNHHIVLFYN